jgi:ketosteroid isomerase-like protein
MGIEQNKALVAEYFRRMQAGEPTVAEMMDDEITWWVPQSSELGGTHRGKAKVLELMGTGVDLYQFPLKITVEEMVAERDWVCVQLVVEAKTAAGRPYRNDYHFAFRIQGGKVAAVREYVDTQYAKELLFDGR